MAPETAQRVVRVRVSGRVWICRGAALLASAGLGLALAVSVLIVARPSRTALAGPLRAPNLVNYPGAAPCNTTLQACINGTAAGETIQIAAGIYVTSVTLNQAISLVGAGIGATTIQALAGQRVMTVTAVMTGSTRIANMTLQNGTGVAQGGGLYLAAGAQPLLQDLSVASNSAAAGGGIYATSPITLSGVTVFGNIATSGAGGGMLAAGAVAASDSVFQNNAVITSGDGGGVAALAAFTGTNVSFINNTATGASTGNGGGLYAGGPLTLTGGLFQNNRTTYLKFYGGGGGLAAFNSISISATRFISNTASDWGGGAYLANFTPNGTAALTSVTFISNTAQGGGGGGLFMWYTSTLTAADFYSNSASYHGGGTYAGYGGNYATSLVGGVFVSNTTNSGGGGLYSDSDLALDGTQFLYNTARSGNGGGAYTIRNATVTRTYFAHNTVIAGGNSGGLDTAGSVTISASSFFNNRTLTGSGGGSGAGVNANLTNVQYISNSAQLYGGAILAYGTARLTDTQVLSNATASYGGGLATTSAVVASSQFENNRGSDGGGVYGAAAAQITETVFISNAATGHGGGLFASGPCAVDGGRFERNRATGPGQGGAIYCNAPTLNISGTQILSNSAGSEGGGVRALTTTLTNTTLLYNTSGGAGGALQCYGPLLISGSTFQQNHSAGNGAGLSCTSTVQIEGSQFISNTAGGDSALGGGAVAASQALTATYSTFAGNSAANSGGGALATYQRVYLDHATFTGNTVAAGDGGAVYALNGALVDHANFTGNQSGRNGGALAITGTLTLSSSTLVGNYANNGGGLLAAAGGSIANALFARNSALGAGQQLYLAPTTTLQVRFATVAAPSLTGGEAILVNGSGSVDLQNTIVTSHSIGLHRQNGTVTQDYNLFYGNTTLTFGLVSGGSHTVLGSPRFANAPGDNYHLQAGSAALNAGVDVGVYTDYDGDARPLSTGFDIGYDEVVSLFQVLLPIIAR